MKVAAPPLDLTLRRAGNLSRGHQNTQNILKRKKRTDTQYDNKARLDGQRTGKHAAVNILYSNVVFTNYLLVSLAENTIWIIRFNVWRCVVTQTFKIATVI